MADSGRPGVQVEAFAGGEPASLKGEAAFDFRARRQGERVKRKCFPPVAAAIALLWSPSAAAGPADLLAPDPQAAASPTAAATPICEGSAAERTALETERAELNKAIGDIALGRSRKKRKVSGGEVAAGAAGTVASVLLPFGVGALLSAGAGAAAKASRKKKPAPPPPDVPAMIERLRGIDSRIAALGGCGGE